MACSKNKKQYKEILMSSKFCSEIANYFKYENGAPSSPNNLKLN